MSDQRGVALTIQGINSAETWLFLCHYRVKAALAIRIPFRTRTTYF